MKNFIAFTIFSFLFLMFSCTNDDIVTEFDQEIDVPDRELALIDSTLGFTVKVQDSTLYFLNSDDLLKAIMILKNISVSERQQWEKSIGFKSAQTVLENIYEKREEIQSEDEFYTFIESNKELIKESTDNLSGIKSRIYGFYPYITSTRGFFVSEAYWGRAFDGLLYSCHLTDYESYNVISELSSNSDISGLKVKAIRLDFNEDNLKSYHHEDYYNSTKIGLSMHNYAINNPTKISTFEMEIINTYSMSSLSSTETTYRYYFEVYYDTYCCDPNNYSYYNAAMGGWQYFEYMGDRTWRIEVPYEGYEETLGWIPNWTTETSYQIANSVYWYNYTGRVDVKAEMNAEKRTLYIWGPYNKNVIYFKDVVATVTVGTNVSGHSSSGSKTIGPFGKNYISKIDGSSWGSDQYVASITQSEYTSKPPAVFTGCASGQIFSEFCPDQTFTFSHNY